MAENIAWGSMLIPLVLTAVISGGASFFARSVVEAEHYGYLDTQAKANRDAISELHGNLSKIEVFIRETRDSFVIPNTAKIQELANQTIELRKSISEYAMTAQKTDSVIQSVRELQGEHKNIDIVLYRLDRLEKLILDLQTKMDLDQQIVRNQQEELTNLQRVLTSLIENQRPRPKAGGSQQ